jgi:hypothetical protein
MFAVGPAAVAQKLEVLARHCETEGRDPARVAKTILAMQDPLPDVGTFLAGMEEYAQLGVTLVELMPTGPDPVAWVSQLGEQIVPTLRDL